MKRYWWCCALLVYPGGTRDHHEVNCHSHRDLLCWELWFGLRRALVAALCDAPAFEACGGSWEENEAPPTRAKQ